MKRYGDNLPSSSREEFENRNGKKDQFMPAGCAVRQDMMAFIMPADIPNKHMAWNVFSLFKFGRKKIREADNQIPAWK